MRIAPFTAAILALQLAGPPVAAQNREKRPDPRVTAALKSEKLEYKVADAGRLIVTWQIGETERTHEVFVDSSTSALWGFEVRQVWAYAYSVDGEISHRLAQRLLEENGRKILGAWELLRDDNISTVIFTAKIRADLDGKTLRTVMSAVAETADALEEEITQKDRF